MLPLVYFQTMQLLKVGSQGILKKQWARNCLQNAEPKRNVQKCPEDPPAECTVAKVSVFIIESLEYCESVHQQVSQNDGFFLGFWSWALSHFHHVLVCERLAQHAEGQIMWICVPVGGDVLVVRLWLSNHVGQSNIIAGTFCRCLWLQWEQGSVKLTKRFVTHAEMRCKTSDVCH